MARFFATALLMLASVGAAFGGEAKHVVVITIDGLPAFLMDDPKASLPVLRGMAERGALAEGMEVANTSMTWPNHTTLMSGFYTAKHGVIFNGLLERKGDGQPVSVSPTKTQQELVRVPLIFDILKEKGHESAAINWPCTRGSESIADNFPDVPNMLEYTTPRLKKELEEKGVLRLFTGGSGVSRDEVWTEAALQVIRDRMPSLLALHLLNLDSTHHRFGPRTDEGYTAAAVADANVGRVLDALDEAGIRDQTAVIVVADHGFHAITKGLNPNVLLRKAGLIELDGRTIKSARVHVVSSGGIAMVYLLDPETADEDRQTVLELFADQEGIETILHKPEDFERHHYPQPKDNQGMGDLVLAAKPGYSFGGSPLGDDWVVPRQQTTGSHGFLATDPAMNAVFVAEGAGIQKGARLGVVRAVDVAPTVMQLLGETLEETDGKVLTEALDSGK